MNAPSTTSLPWETGRLLRASRRPDALAVGLVGLAMMFNIASATIYSLSPWPEPLTITQPKPGPGEPPRVPPTETGGSPGNADGSHGLSSPVTDPPLPPTPDPPTPEPPTPSPSVLERLYGALASDLAAAEAVRTTLGLERDFQPSEVDLIYEEAENRATLRIDHALADQGVRIASELRSLVEQTASWTDGRSLGPRFPEIRVLARPAPSSGLCDRRDLPGQLLVIVLPSRRQADPPLETALAEAIASMLAPETSPLLVDGCLWRMADRAEGEAACQAAVPLNPLTDWLADREQVAEQRAADPARWADALRDGLDLRDALLARAADRSQVTTVFLAFSGWAVESLGADGATIDALASRAKDSVLIVYGLDSNRPGRLGEMFDDYYAFSSEASLAQFRETLLDLRLEP